MIYPEIQIFQTLNQESDKPQIKHKPETEISGWTDQPLVFFPKRKAHCVKHKSISQKIRSETSSSLNKRFKTNHRQQSIQVKYASANNDFDINFKDIDKSFFLVQNNLTPKLRNLINSINRAKITKMNEIVKKNKSVFDCPNGLKIQKISPFRNVQTPGIFESRVTGQRLSPFMKLKRCKPSNK